MRRKRPEYVGGGSIWEWLLLLAGALVIIFLGLRWSKETIAGAVWFFDKAFPIVPVVILFALALAVVFRKPLGRLKRRWRDMDLGSARKKAESDFIRPSETR